MVKIERTNSDNKDFQKLILHLDADLDSRDREAHSVCAQYNNTDTIKHVIVAYEDNKAIGCGAIREYASDAIEIKRMFVERNKRGKGLASLILKELEEWSKELNYKIAILETGLKFPDAIRLYEKNNYSRISNYGQYKAIESSICFAKKLTI